MKPDTKRKTKIKDYVFCYLCGHKGKGFEIETHRACDLFPEIKEICEGCAMTLKEAIENDK